MKMSQPSSALRQATSVRSSSPILLVIPQRMSTTETCTPNGSNSFSSTGSSVFMKRSRSSRQPSNGLDKNILRTPFLTTRSIITSNFAALILKFLKYLRNALGHAFVLFACGASLPSLRRGLFLVTNHKNYKK